MTHHIEKCFPKLLTSLQYKPTSPKDVRYNCIAHAAGSSTHWWWPDRFWPRKIPARNDIASFRKAFESLGYTECKNANLETGLEKIAIYIKHGEPQHAARQLPDGSWTSKMGESEDISHALSDLEGGIYGNVALLMSRPRIEKKEAGSLRQRRAR